MNQPHDLMPRLVSAFLLLFALVTAPLLSGCNPLGFIGDSGDSEEQTTEEYCRENPDLCLLEEEPSSESAVPSEVPEPAEAAQ